MSESILIVGREFKFEAAHKLPGHPGKCAVYHGHSYTVKVEIEGYLDPLTEMVIDFYDLKQLVNKYIDYLDHQDLCEIFPEMRTTVENLVVWFADKIASHFSNDFYIIITIREGEGGWAQVSRIGYKA